MTEDPQSVTLTYEVEITHWVDEGSPSPTESDLENVLRQGLNGMGYDVAVDVTGQ